MDLIQAYKTKINNIIIKNLSIDDIDEIERNKELIIHSKIVLQHLEADEQFVNIHQQKNSSKNHNDQLDENTNGEEDEERLIDRKDNSIDLAVDIENFMKLRQGQQESLRDYVDRYFESYLRMPVDKNAPNPYYSFQFIKSLLPKTGEEVTNWLKRNKKRDWESYLPNTLHEFFEYLGKFFREIEENLYSAVTTPPVPINAKSYINVGGSNDK